MIRDSVLHQLRTRVNLKDVAGISALVLLAFLTFLMARISVEYFPYSTDVGFLQIKQQYIDIDHWRIAFFIHVYASLWVLFAGFTQFSERLRALNPRLHRVVGYIYAFDIILITGPAGLVMGFYANGGATSRIAFVMLAIGWIWFTAMAVKKAKDGDYTTHRDYMIRSFALTASALTLRAWKWGINNTVELPPMDVYRAVAWLGWVPNLLFAEILIRYRRRKWKVDGRR